MSGPSGVAEVDSRTIWKTAVWPLTSFEDWYKN